MKGHPFILIKDRNPTTNRYCMFINNTGFPLTLDIFIFLGYSGHVIM